MKTSTAPPKSVSPRRRVWRPFRWTFGLSPPLTRRVSPLLLPLPLRLSVSYIPPSHFVVLRKFLFSWAGFLFVVVVFCFESAICGPVDDPKLECQRVSLIFDRLDSSSSSSSSSSLIPIPVDLCRVFIQFYWFSFRQVQGRFRRSAISKTRTVAGCFPRYRFTLK